MSQRFTVCVKRGCVFSYSTWVYWPRLYPGGRSSGTPSPTGRCRHSAWSSLCAPWCRQQPPPPAVAPPEDPNLDGDTEALTNWNQNTASSPAKPIPTVSHCAFTHQLFVKMQNREQCYITGYRGNDLHLWMSPKKIKSCSFTKLASFDLKHEITCNKWPLENAQKIQIKS